MFIYDQLLVGALANLVKNFEDFVKFMVSSSFLGPQEFLNVPTIVRVQMQARE